MLALLAFALLQAPAEAPTAPAPARLKVLVLDVASADLTASERTTLTNLEAAQLSEDARLEVLSGEDLKQLVKLQGEARELGVEGECTDACMAELAGALGAGVVISTQAGKLGETFVVTLVVFDAAKAKGVSRKSIQASSLGELPAKLAPALDALLRPLLPAPTSTSAPVVEAPPPPSTPAVMSARLQELYDVEAMQVCIDENDRAVWWFCNKKRQYTENEFVRSYRELTGAHDLDGAEVDRGVNVLVPIGLMGLAAAGTGTVVAVIVCTEEDCGSDASATLDMNASPVAIGLLAAGMVAVTGGLIAGSILFGEVGPDGTPQEHTLSEGQGRGAIARYNEALKAKLARELGE